MHLDNKLFANCNHQMHNNLQSIHKQFFKMPLVSASCCILPFAINPTKSRIREEKTKKEKRNIQRVRYNLKRPCRGNESDIKVCFITTILILFRKLKSVSSRWQFTDHSKLAHFPILIFFKSLCLPRETLNNSFQFSKPFMHAHRQKKRKRI